MSSPPPPDPPAAARRVLVAEDETVIRLDLRAILENRGYEVLEAANGEQAVSVAVEERPDAAVVDVKMPVLDGISAARRIAEAAPLPIVMLTAFDQQALVERAAEAGAYGYLVKPFREQDVVPAIQTAWARFHEHRRVREEAERLSESLAARKAIERAKGLLMQRDGLSEDDAYKRLRKASQITGRKLHDVANTVILALDVKQGEGPSGS